MYNQRQSLEVVQMLDFAIQEANLYLDTHPDNQNALAYFKGNQKLAREARADYEAKYGPLTFMNENNDRHWNWIDGPWPWEGEA